MPVMTESEPMEKRPVRSRWLPMFKGIAWVLFLVAISAVHMALALRKDIVAGKLVEPSNLMTLLFGASTIALGVFALLAGGFALFGWGYLKENVKKEVEESLRARIDAVEKESRGRIENILGYSIGENSVKQDTSSPLDKERLREAIQHCDLAYTLLKGTGLPVEFAALNNYLYYSCILGDTSRRDYLLTCAGRLREAAIEHSSQNLLLTYARTILTFSKKEGQIAQACDFVEDVKENPPLNEKQKREADYLASLCEQRSRATDRSGRDATS